MVNPVFSPFPFLTFITVEAAELTNCTKPNSSLWRSLILVGYLLVCFAVGGGFCLCVLWGLLFVWLCFLNQSIP